MRSVYFTARKKQTLFIRLMFLALITILILSVLTPTVFAKTYVIRDGHRVVTYTTFATDPAQILTQAGLSLGEYDTYTTEPEQGSQTITISRAQSITIHYHGQTTTATSQGETVGELIRRLELEVSGEDVVSHGLDEATRDGMILRIDQVITRQETYSAAIAHQVTRCNDPSLPRGMEEVLTRGQDGQLLRTADVTYVNGIETHRQILSETVTRAPVTEIIGVGTADAAPEANPEAPVISDGFIYLPTGEVLTYTDTATIRATAYTHTDEGCDMITATGTTVHWGTVAVDPRYIPYGTRMFISASDGSYIYGISVAEDCGGAIKGDRMDLYMPTYDQCIEFGRRVCTIYFLG